MKTIKGFLRTLRVTPIYVDLFSSREDVFNQFAKGDEPDIQILYANYNYEDYSGYAVVLYYRKSTKKYYETYGSHCSCYGLEDQWERDEEIVAEELLKRNGELNRLFLEYQK
jgi:hypothetical protein